MFKNKQLISKINMIVGKETINSIVLNHSSIINLYIQVWEY